MKEKKLKKSIIPYVLFFGMILTSLSFVYGINPDHNICSICHQLHTAPGQSLTNDEVVETLCLSCHGPGGIAIKKAEVHTNKAGSSYPAFRMTCPDCHNSHDSMQNYLGGTNLAQVGTRTASSSYARVKLPSVAGGGDADVVFEQRGSDADPPYDNALHSFADGDVIYDGICEVCHTVSLQHRNDGSAAMHDAGKNCMECHSHNVGFEGSGGGCMGCHGSPKDNDDGPPTRRAMVGEFGLTSHHGSTTLADSDCMVCHHEAKDDGTGTIVPDIGYHMNNLVELRNPDTNAVVSFTQFTRNTASDSLESWVIDVQNNHCFKCHDSDGALNESIPMLPFASGNSPANVWDQFNPSLNNHHAVRGSVNNPYCTSTTLEAPWDSGELISCFDCHGTSGHGHANQRMLRTSIDFDSMEAAVVKGDLPSGMGVTVESFCTLCHRSTVYVGSGAGSIFEFHGTDQNQHRAAGGNELGCMGCHGGIKNLWVDRDGIPDGDNHSARGNIHGVNFTWGSDSFASGSSTEKFQIGGWLSGWELSGTTGYCRGGSCNHAKSSKDYTADTTD